VRRLQSWPVHCGDASEVAHFSLLAIGGSRASPSPMAVSASQQAQNIPSCAESTCCQWNRSPVAMTASASAKLRIREDAALPGHTSMAPEHPPRARGRQHVAAPPPALLGATPAGAAPRRHPAGPGRTPTNPRGTSGPSPGSYPRWHGDEAAGDVQLLQARELPRRRGDDAGFPGGCADSSNARVDDRARPRPAVRLAECRIARVGNLGQSLQQARDLLGQGLGMLAELVKGRQDRR
jgi:hypothetical protein